MTALVLAALLAAQGPVRVGSKKFTESVVLGEIATQLLQAERIPATHRAELGGTRVLWDALRHHDLDLYPEYTGTLREEILAGRGLASDGELPGALAALGLTLGAPLGFEDGYALGMREDRAEALGIRTLSDLARHPELRLGLSHELLDRADGWPRLRARYGLPQTHLRGLDHDLAYRAVQSGAVDVVDLYSTDAQIEALHLRVLQDDRHAFPTYAAVFVLRRDLDPRVASTLARLAGRVDARRMVHLNAEVELQHRPAAQVAAAFLRDALGVDARPKIARWPARVALRTREHLVLVGLSLLAAIALGLPLGVLAVRRPRLGQLVLGLTGAVQTIPALALLVFMIPLLGIGTRPALLALFLYALLPIVRGVHAGLLSIPSALRGSARALGLPARARLLRVELPLASRSILAGIKTAAVISVGTATLGALVGAGGYGQPILSGIRLSDVGLILEGAVPSAVMALAVQGLFGLVEKRAVPRGLRL